MEVMKWPNGLNKIKGWKPLVCSFKRSKFIRFIHLWSNVKWWFLSSLYADKWKKCIHCLCDWRLYSFTWFLSQYVFENEEGYIFLHQLFEQAIASNRNKPVLFDPDYVFVSGFGDRFAFVVVPIQISNWCFKKICLKNGLSISQRLCKRQPHLKFLAFYWNF